MMIKMNIVIGGGGGGGKFNTPGSSLRKPNWDMNALPRFEKNFYREAASVQARSMQVCGSLL